MRIIEAMGGILAAAVVLSSGLAASAADPTLEVVKKRGELICGSNGHLPGLSVVDGQQHWTGFEVDFCHAVAAAALGDAAKVKFIPLTTADRFDALRSGQIDLLVRNTAGTLSRVTGAGVRDAAIIYIDGQAVAVSKKLGIAVLKDIDKATICILKGSIYGANISDWFELHKLPYTLLTLDTQADVFEAFYAGRCNAVTQDITALTGTIVGSGKAADYLMLPDIVAKDPLAAFVRTGDVPWANVVRWTFAAMVEAEEYGVTQANVDDMRTSGTPLVRRLLGTDPGNGKLLNLDENWAYNVIKQVGNYGEVYERNVGMQSALKFPRGVNALWTNGGAIYGLPLR